MAGQPPIICLMGPTASGKTQLAMALARVFPVDLISVDSALVYRGLDIGTAKPSAEALAAVPHRLIDIRDPAERYSAAEFRADALAAIASIRRAGRLPLLVGGTMLYFRALRYGLADLPGADAAVRARLEARAAVHGWPALHARLRRIDPNTAARLHPNDAQRIQRALEVWELSGWTLSEHYAATGEERLSYPVVNLIVAPGRREWLHRRIDSRFRGMLAAGFIDEVAGLRARDDLSPALPAMRAVGYRQVWGYLDGLYDYHEMLARGIAATRQFAKRQLSWLRREDNAQWFEASCGDVVNRLQKRLARVLNSGR